MDLANYYGFFIKKTKCQKSNDIDVEFASLGQNNQLIRYKMRLFELQRGVRMQKGTTIIYVQNSREFEPTAGQLPYFRLTQVPRRTRIFIGITKIKKHISRERFQEMETFLNQNKDEISRLTGNAE